MKIFTLLAALLIATSLSSNAQIDITYPSSRAVFQRDNGNGGKIVFGGNFKVKLDRIEARLTPISGGNAVDWQTVVTNPTNGFYATSINASGGWYNLEVRGIFNGEAIVSAQLSPVGIGEVFVICGQSNAQGRNGSGQTGAVDDRVNCVTGFYTLNDNLQPFPVFGKIEANTVISPTGNNAWYWGKLGDLLVQRLNVPVLFINTAWDGLNIDEWNVSIDGQSGVNPFSQIPAANGFPYNSLKNSLQQYTQMLGVRAVLFHQGESDNYLKTSQAEYISKLTRLINTTRLHSNKNLSWVVARVSHDQFSYSYQPVIDAQNNVINSVNNVFAGPETDPVNDRYDGIHFDAVGQQKVAQLWSNSLNDNFFSNSTPYQPADILATSSFCNTGNPDNPIRLSIQTESAKYKWNNGSEAQTINVNLGSYQARGVDATGNTRFTPLFNFNESLIPNRPTISIDGPQEFCQDSRITKLTSNYNFNNYWSSDVIANSINVKSSGTFSVTHTNVYGCDATSNPVTITVFPKPTPQITLNGSANICSDQESFLSSNYSSGNLWSDGRTDQQIKLTQTDNLTLTVTNEYGCQATTGPQAVFVRPAAEKPTIKIDGAAAFCENDSTRLVAFSEGATKYQWSNDKTGSILPVKLAGEYKVTATNADGCSKTSDVVSITTFPLPAKPTVIPNGPTTLCQSSSLTLSVNENSGYLWNTGETTRNISVYNTGSFSVKIIDDKGCVSPESSPISIKFLDSPTTPVIKKEGLYTLTAVTPDGDPFSDVTFIWKKDNIDLKKTIDIIKGAESGNYQVYAVKAYKVDNDTLSCLSDPSAPLFVTVDYTESFTLYPNPVTAKKLSIETLNDYNNTKIIIYSLWGQLVREYTVDVFDSRKTFDLSNLPGGMYIIKISNSEFTTTRKIFIE